MQPEKVEALGSPPKSLGKRKLPSNSQSSAVRQEQQVFRREFPEGWSRWVEPDRLSDAGEFLDDWGNSILQLDSDPDTDGQELRREATAWERAMHAYSNWRAA